MWKEVVSSGVCKHVILPVAHLSQLISTGDEYRTPVILFAYLISYTSYRVPWSGRQFWQIKIQWHFLGSTHFQNWAKGYRRAKVYHHLLDRGRARARGPGARGQGPRGQGPGPGAQGARGPGAQGARGQGPRAGGPGPGPGAVARAKGQGRKGQGFPIFKLTQLVRI